VKTLSDAQRRKGYPTVPLTQEKGRALYEDAKESEKEPACLLRTEKNLAEK